MAAKCLRLGKAKLGFEIEDKLFTDDFIIVHDLARECILVTPFFRKYQVSLDFMSEKECNAIRRDIAEFKIKLTTD